MESWGTSVVMTDLNSVVSTTLLADHNHASVSAMLDAILRTPLTPMEASQAKSYYLRDAGCSIFE